MSETTPAAWAQTYWPGSPSPWQTLMPLASRVILTCQGTDCILSGVTGEVCGASRFRATGGSPSDLKMTMFTTST